MNDILDGQRWRVLQGDALATLRTLPDNCVHCCATSPPYYALRDYGHAGQIGLEATPEEYVRRLVEVFEEVRRVLRPDGTCWINLGDSYAGSGMTGGTASKEASAKRKDRMFSGHRRDTVDGYKHKDRLGIPHLVVFALRAAGWYWRDEIIWAKPSVMPESVTDRCTKSHECVFLLTKSARYWYDQEAIKEPATHAEHVRCYGGLYVGDNTDRKDGGRSNLGGAESRNRRSVWTVATVPYGGAHFAVFPPKLVEPMILAGCPARTCATCGAPHRRVVAKERKPTRPGVDTKCLVKSDGDVATADVLGWSSPQVIGNRDPQRHCTTTRTVGWEPGCGCSAGVVPGVVLDPFGGSGTTAEVAVTLGRRALLVELNPAYVGLIHERLRHVQPPLPGMEPGTLPAEEGTP